MPRPPMTRQRMRSPTLKVRPEPIDETKNMIAPRNITRRRPQRSDRLPAMIAPTAQPSSATATTKPVMTGFSSKFPSIESTAPLMTDESKPKRNPPTAAATESPTALRPYGLRNENEPVGMAPASVMGTHYPRPCRPHRDLRRRWLQ